MEQTGVYRALLIGVCQYQAEGSLSPLRGVTTDVNRLAEVLEDPERGGYDDVVVLAETDSTSLDSPTRANMLHAMHELTSRAEEGDTILLYFAGHGVRRGDTSLLIAADSRMSVIQDSAVPLDRLRRALVSCSAAARVALIDACHSDVTRGEEPGGAQAFWDDEILDRGSGIALLGSCAHDQAAWETPHGGVFTRHIIAGLEGGADANEDGLVTVAELFSYVNANVKEWAEKKSVSQTPTIQEAAVGDIVVAKARRPRSRAKAKGTFAGAAARASVNLASLADRMERDDAIRTYTARISAGLLQKWPPSQQFVHWQEDERRIGLPDGYVAVSWEPPDPDDPFETLSLTARVVILVKSDSRDPFEALEAIVEGVSSADPKASIEIVGIRSDGDLDLDFLCNELSATSLRITDFDPSQEWVLTARGGLTDPDWPVNIRLRRLHDEAWQVEVWGATLGPTRVSFPIRPIADKILAVLQAAHVETAESTEEE